MDSAYLWYMCDHHSNTPEATILHILKVHTDKALSFRKKIFSEETGKYVYKSLDSYVQCNHVQDKLNSGYKILVNANDAIIRFKRQLEDDIICLFHPIIAIGRYPQN